MPRTQQDLSAARSSTIILRYEDRSLLIKRDPCYSKAIRDIQLALRRSFAGVPSSRITLHAKVTGYGNEEHEITAPVWPDVVSHLHHITVNVHRAPESKSGLDELDVIDIDDDDDGDASGPRRAPQKTPTKPQKSTASTAHSKEGPSSSCTTATATVPSTSTSTSSRPPPAKPEKSEAAPSASRKKVLAFDTSNPYPDLALHSEIEKAYLAQRQRSRTRVYPWVTPPKRLHPLVRAFLQDPHPPAVPPDLDADDSKALAWARRHHAQLKVDGRMLVTPGRELLAALLDAHGTHRGIQATYAAVGRKCVGIPLDFVSLWVRSCPSCRKRCTNKRAAQVNGPRYA